MYVVFYVLFSKHMYSYDIIDLLHIPIWFQNYTFLYLFHTSYFHYNLQNGTRSSKNNGQDNVFEHNSS